MIDWTPSTIEGGGDPLGDIRIKGVQGDLLVENTYADAWLDAIVQGLHELVGGAASVTVDLVDEPEPVILQLIDGDVVIGYAGLRAVTGSLRETCRAIAQDVRRLLPALRMQTETSSLLDAVEESVEELALCDGPL